MWKIAVFALVVVFIIADSIYLYFRLKKYWQSASRNKPGQDSKKWKLGLSSLDIPLGKKPESGNQQPDEPDKS